MRGLTVITTDMTARSMEDRDDAAVAIFPAVLRKEKAEFALLRAPLDAPIYQVDEDIEAPLQSSSTSYGVIGIGGLLELLAG
jgi:hypothetical protein